MKNDKIKISWRKFSAETEGLTKRGTIVLLILCATILLLPVITAICIRIIH